MARLVYWQRYVKHEDEFDSFDQALSMAAFHEAYGTAAPDAIIDDDRVVSGDELSVLIWDHEQRSPA